MCHFTPTLCCCTQLRTPYMKCILSSETIVSFNEGSLSFLMIYNITYFYSAIAFKPKITKFPKKIFRVQKTNFSNFHKRKNLSQTISAWTNAVHNNTVSMLISEANTKYTSQIIHLCLFTTCATIDHLPLRVGIQKKKLSS